MFSFWHDDEKDERKCSRHKISPVSLGAAVGQPCQIEAKKEQISSHVYSPTTVTQHLLTYSTSKV